MSKSVRRYRHLQVFGVSLLLIIGALAFFLFSIKIEQTAPGNGVIRSQHLLEIRAPVDGTLDVYPEMGSTILIPVQPGDLISDFPFSFIRVEGKETEFFVGFPKKEAKETLDPKHRWMVTERWVESGHSVRQGQVLFRLVKVNGETKEIVDPLIRVEFDEKHFGSLELKQPVRIYSTMYPYRVHGIAEGEIERLEPIGIEGNNGTRKFVAWVKILHSPFPIRLGSSAKVEVLVGRKKTYQVILEH